MKKNCSVICNRTGKIWSDFKIAAIELKVSESTLRNYCLKLIDKKKFDLDISFYNRRQTWGKLGRTKIKNTEGN